MAAPNWLKTDIKKDYSDVKWDYNGWKDSSNNRVDLTPPPIPLPSSPRKELNSRPMTEGIDLTPVTIPTKKGFWENIRDNEDKITNNPVFKAVTSIPNKLYEIPLTQRFFTTLGNTIGGEGTVHADDGSAMQKMDAGKIGNLAADIAGTGVAYGMKLPGMNNSVQGSINNILNPLETKLLGNLPNMSKAGFKAAEYGVNALKSGIDMSAGNVIQGVAQGQNAEEIKKGAVNGLWQGAVFGTALKGAGDIGKSAFPKWKTTYESSTPVKNAVEAPKPSLEVATTKNTTPIKGTFKIKNTALEEAQKAYDNAVETIHNHFGTNQLTPEEIARVKPELGIDLEKLINNLGTAKTNIRTIGNNQRLAQAAGVVSQPNSKLQPPILNPNRVNNGLSSNTQAAVNNINQNNVPFNPTEKPNQKIVTGENNNKSSFKEKWQNLYMRIVDNKKPIENADETAYIKATNSANSGSIVSHVMEENLVDKEGKVIGDSLKKTLEDNIPKGQETDFWEYVLQRHNINRAKEEYKQVPKVDSQGFLVKDKNGNQVFDNVQTRESKPIYYRTVNGQEIPFTSDESALRAQYLEQQHPEWKQQADNITKWIDDFMQEWGIKTGTVDGQLYGELRTMYPDYIPTNRSFDDLEDFIPGGNGAGKGFVNQNTPIKKATGSSRNIVDPTENIMNLVNRTIRTAKYNEVGQELVRAIEQNPKMISLAQIVPEPKGKADNVVKVLNGGKPVYIEVNDKNLLAALEAVNKAEVGDIEAVVKKGTNLFKSLITTKNPVFAVRNMFRDIPTAYINGSEANPVKFFIDLAKATKDIVTNSDKFKQYKGVGGGGSNFFNSGSPTKSATELTGRVPIVKNGAIVGYKNINPIKQGFKKVGDVIEHVNNIVESAPRLAEFNRVLDKTGDVNKALYAANDVTTNFSRGGDITKKLDSGVPYLNAGVQGLDKLARQFINKPIPTAAKGLIGITSMTLYLDHINKDNPKYQELDNRTKDNYFLFPKEDGTFVKIPKSREYGVLFSDLLERTLRKARGQENSFKGFGNTVKTSFSPANPFEANIISPALGLKSNKDFANRDIIPRAMVEDNRSKYLQYDEKTSELTKWFAQQIHDMQKNIEPEHRIDLSPKQMDYLIRSYTGVIGQLGLPATTKATMSGGNTKEKLLKPVTSQFIADPLYSNQNITDFYDNYDKIKTITADKNITENIPSKIQTVEERYKSIYTKASSKMSDLNKAIREAELKNNQEEVKRLRYRMIEAAVKANKAFKEYKK